MNNTHRAILSTSVLALFALLAVASGGKKGAEGGEGGAGSSASIKQSCNMISFLGTCTEYPEGSSFVMAEMACGMGGPDAGSVWGKEKCPTDRVVGKCVDGTKDALYKNETEYYYAPEHTADTAKKDCVDEAMKKGKTFSAVEFKPKAGEARGSCTKKLIGSKRNGPDNCEEWPYETSTESWAVLKMNCSGSGETLAIGKACSDEAKSGASSKCTEKNGTVVYNFPPDAKNAKDFCEGPPGNGKWEKLGGTAAAGGTPPAKGGATKPATTAAPKASAKPKP